MKLLDYILAFYIIGLAAVPCCSMDDCPEEKTGQTTNHENRDEDCGSCSPFFSCEGCASATVDYQPVQFEFIFPPTSPVYTVYQQSSLPKVDLDFWQPPKLG